MTAKNSSLYCVMIVVGMTLVLGCSNQRNTSASRTYHELTTRYNIYYNAEKAYREILENQLERSEEDYTDLLTFYPGAPTKEKQLPGGPFDVVVEKTTRAIKEHSISAKPRRDPTQPQSPEFRQWLQQEEFNPFIHKAWLLLGKAHLQNGDYEAALAIFRQIQQLFKQDNELITESEIWLLRTYTEMGRDYDAENMLYALQSKTISPHLQDLFTEINAARFVHKKEYTAAIPWLKKSIDREKNFTRKKRLQFLLGQIYSLQGDLEMAQQAFEDVKGLHTPGAINRQATLAQVALKDKLSKQEMFNPIETSMASTTPEHPTEAQLDDSTQLSNSAQSHPFQNYQLAYLKRSSFKESTNDSIPQSSLHPAISTTLSRQSSPIVNRAKTREELKKQLEEKAAEALQKKPQTVTNKSRKKLLKEQEKERKAKLRQREKELRERERKREASIKQKEKERELLLRKQQRQ